jgi:hypothetical protein
VAFLGSQLVIANQSYLAGSKTNQALLTLETGEPGQPVFVPQSAAPAPSSHKARRKRHQPRRHHRRRSARRA